MSPLVLVHLSAASSAVVLGASQLVLAKRGIRHRSVGYGWMLAMAVTALSSFGLKSSVGWSWLGGFSWIHGLSLFTLVAIVMATVSAIRRDFPAHRSWVLRTYAGLVIAGVAAFLVPGRALHALLFVALPQAIAPLASAFF